MKPDKTERNWMDECLALLQFMNSGQPWSIGVSNIYQMVLNSIGEEWSRKTVGHIAITEEWRPAPAAIRKIAARLASPFPSLDDAYAEMMRKAEREGLYGVQCSHDPNVYFEGVPEFSHPLIEKSVRACGGWRSICNGESQMQEGLSKQFRGVYQRYSEEWVGDVANVLSLPEEKRPQKLFPKYVPDEEPNWLLTLANPADAPKQITGSPEVTPEFKKRVMKLIGKIGN